MSNVQDPYGILNDPELTRDADDALDQLKRGIMPDTLLMQSLLSRYNALENSQIIDPLTKKHNSQGFRQNIADSITRLKSASHSERVAHNEYEITAPAVVLIDVDGFKSINDEYGHEYGDAMLKTVANVLDFSTRGDELVARLGGDEFGILFHRVKEGEPAKFKNRLDLLVEQYLQNERIRQMDPKAYTGLSIGATFLHPEMSVHNSLRNADNAMYHSKLHVRRGEKRSAELHSPEINYRAIKEEVNRLSKR